MTSPEDTQGDLAGFEKDLEALEALVGQMEQGDLSLETALREFERGIALTRRCQQALNQAEQKVRQLTEEGAETEFETPGQTGPDGED
ncbi:MAG: exodeoxyribonuclease VII small subunit [Ectothiorhodospira sp.]